MCFLYQPSHFRNAKQILVTPVIPKSNTPCQGTALEPAPSVSHAPSWCRASPAWHVEVSSVLRVGKWANICKHDIRLTLQVPIKIVFYSITLVLLFLKNVAYLGGIGDGIPNIAI